ncbi:MAG: hypothetical protein QF578_02425 [Alphaproteobacteria bacterium]|nr:hypothetical protein [Alphaproteobacteria bacterium]MDP6815594.1 hypothetical protein [Alphaproteobacteria bacterium]
MIEIEIPDDEGLPAARDRFAELSDTRQLLRGDPSASRKISAGRLYAYANSPAADPEVEAELARNVAARRAYRGYLQAAASYRPGVAIAASTEAIPPRRGVGCTVRVEPSQAEPDQYIVIVEIDPAQPAPEVPPSTLVLCDVEDNCHRFPLPSAHRGVIQFIVTEDSAELELLRDPRTEALLR